MPVQIAVRNLTGSDLTIQDLGIILTAASDTELTGSFTPEEVRFSNDLNNSIIADDVLILSNGILYTKEQSLIFMSGGGLVSETLTILGAGTVTIASGTNQITVSGSDFPIIAGNNEITVISGTNAISIYGAVFPAIIGGTDISVVSGSNTITINNTAGDGAPLPIVGDSFITVATGMNSIKLSSDSIIPGSSNIVITSGSNTVSIDLANSITVGTVSGTNVQVGESVTAQQGHFSTALTVSGVPVDVGVQSNIEDNLLINGGFMVNQRLQFNTSFTSSSLFTNADGNYTLDRWVLLSDGNDIANVVQGITLVPSGTWAAADLSVVTTNKKFGFLQIVENFRTASVIKEKVSLQFQAGAQATSGPVTINTVRAAILGWVGANNFPTRDVVSSWNTAGTNPTLVSQWEYLNTPSALELPTTTSLTEGAYGLFKIENISVPGTVKNLGVFIWTDDTSTTAGQSLLLANVKLEKGSKCSEYRESHFSDELLRCQRFFCKTYSYSTSVGTGTTACSLSVHSPSNSAGDVRAIWRFPVNMFVSPTVTTYNPSTGATGSWNRGGTAVSASAVFIGTQGCTITNSASTSSDQDHEIQATADCEMGL